LKDGESLPNVESLKIPLQLGLANDEGFPHTGVINFTDNKVDPTTGTIQTRGTFNNADRHFKPGLFARVRVPIGGSYEALLVTESALGTDQGQKFVLVVDAQGVVERRFVKPGPLQDDGLRVISDGSPASGS
jgi:multidrug efflux pump subunit AcrA (membrane-fusion protein)